MTIRILELKTFLEFYLCISYYSWTLFRCVWILEALYRICGAHLYNER